MEDHPYPMFVCLRQRPCLVVGGGEVGERKVRTLLGCGAEVRLVAQALTPWLQSRCEAQQCRYLGEDYQEGQLDDVDLVFAATSDVQLNQQIAADAAARRIWCNTASNPEQGSFIVPATLRRGPLQIAVSTGGMSPALARGIRDSLLEQFGLEWGAYLGLLGRLRAAIQTRELGTETNQRLFRELVHLPLLECIRDNRHEDGLSLVFELLQPHFSRHELSLILEQAWTPLS